MVKTIISVKKHKIHRVKNSFTALKNTTEK